MDEHEHDYLPEHVNNLWEDMDRLNALYEVCHAGKTNE